MLNNCKEKGEKLERMGKNSRVGIFIISVLGYLSSSIWASPALFANLAASISWYISSQKIVQLSERKV